MTDPTRPQGAPPEKMGLTTFRQVLVAALAGALIGFFLLSLFDLFNAFPPVVPWSVPAVLVVMAIGCWIYAHGLARRVADRTASSVEAVRALVVAKSVIMVGSVLAGMHVVYVGTWLPQVQAPLPAARVGFGTATILASLLLVWAGHRLEKACVSPDHDPDADGEDGGSEQGDTLDG